MNRYFSYKLKKREHVNLKKYNFMCGIAGIISKSDLNNKTIIKQMVDALSHRGPDAEGIFTDEKVSLGHRRLSIIDLSTNANQPFSEINKRYTIVFNGEIYNYQEIKSQLEYPWQSTSDTEVILAAYIKWGTDCLQYLNGMFAFAIYDKTEQEIFIARDRLGVKPLYYFHSDDCFMFSSEVRSLLSSGIISRIVDINALKGYLSGLAVQVPQCIVKGITQFCPGEYLSLIHI
jgi:asparagine synthase (glutamine-hydrolysing)